MSLIAVLILLPTPALHAWGLNEAFPGGLDRRPTVARLVRDAGSGAFQSDNAVGEWGDDDGANPFLDAPALPRPHPPGAPSSRRCRSSLIQPLSLRSHHLRC